MAGTRPPLPPIARSVTPLEWGIVLGLWLLLAIASAGPLQQQLAEQGIALSVRDLRVAQVLDWAVWALLLPLAFAALDRFPIRRGARLRHLAAWGIAALAFGVAHALLSHPLILLAARLLEVPPETLTHPRLSLPRLMLEDAEAFSLVVVAYVALQWIHRGREERARAREAERSFREARLHALGLELQPHFLFNTLNGITALVRSDPRAAEEMLIRLSDLLRLTLDAGRAGQVPLGEELRQLELYLGLQQMRHGDRLTVRTDVPPEIREARVPAMLLQPLVENALSHGIGGRPGPGSIGVRAWRENGQLYLAVEDDGVGMPESPAAGPGIGLANTRARLAALYPDAHELSIGPRPQGGTRVLIRFPYTAAAPGPVRA